MCIAGISMAIVYHSNVSDTEIWGGTIISKTRDKVSCEHSYRCRCHNVCSGTGKNRTCSEHCDTCYDHFYDVDWFVTTSNSENIYISRINRQGTEMPPRWAIIKIGDPTSTEHSFDNYIKAAPGTLFKREGFKKENIPKYPSVYDYYKINRVINDTNHNINSWNKDLEFINSHIAREKQANLILVLTNKNKDFFYTLQQAWLGGKKNDIVLVIGTDNNEVKWADVLAWSKTKDIHVQLRDDIMELNTLDKNQILEIFKNDVLKFYNRKPMRDFEYLKSSITPTSAQLTVSIIVGIIVASIMVLLFHKNDLFEINSRVNNFDRFR